MTEFTGWLSIFIFNYPILQYLIIFLGAAFGGELALFALGFLTAQGTLHIVSLIIFSFLGTLSSDILWFLLGKTVLFERIISHRYAHSTVSTISEAIHRVSRGSRPLALIFAKFLVGTRIVIIMYISKNNIEFRDFVKYDSLAIILWLLVVIPIGFISGLGFTYLAKVLNNIYAGIGFVLLILLIVIMIQVWFEKKFTKKV